MADFERIPGGGLLGKLLQDRVEEAFSRTSTGNKEILELDLTTTLTAYEHNLGDQPNGAILIRTSDATPNTLLVGARTKDTIELALSGSDESVAVWVV